MFLNRRTTVFRKAFELHDRCNVHVAVIIDTGTQTHIFDTDNPNWTLVRLHETLR